MCCQRHSMESGGAVYAPCFSETIFLDTCTCLCNMLLRMFCRTNSDGNAVSFDTLFDNDHSLSVCHDDSFADAFGKRRMAPSGETVSMVRRKMPWDCRAVLCRFSSQSVRRISGWRRNALHASKTALHGEKLLCVCYGGGPAFLLGLLGNVPCRSAIFWLIFSANILSNAVLCTLLFRFHPLKNDVSERKTITPVSAEMLVDCTSGAGKLLLKLCGVILCFSAWIGMADAAGLFRICREWTMKIELPFSGSDLLRCVLEISNCAALSMPMRWRVPVLAALLSFGGICVILQIRAVVGTSLSMKLLITVRLLCGLLSGGICAVGLHFLPIPITETVVSVSAVSQVSRNSIVPSVLLLCMMLFVFREESFLHNHKKIREIA